MNRQQTRQHFNRLAQTHRPSRGLSCGFDDRYAPQTMSRNTALLEQIDAVLDRCLASYDGSLGTVVDVGCGTQFYRGLLERRFARVIGVDAAAMMLRAGNEELGAGRETLLATAEAEKLPFLDEVVDCVLGFDLLHHLDAPEMFAAEVARVLGPRGVYIGIEPNMLNPGMWLGHLLPAEERGALRFNWPWRLSRLFDGRFLCPEIRYFNLSISSGLASFARRLHPFRAAGSSPLAMRIGITARKRR